MIYRLWIRELLFSFLSLEGLMYAKYGGSRFLHKIGAFLPDYTALHIRRYVSAAEISDPTWSRSSEHQANTWTQAILHDGWVAINYPTVPPRVSGDSHSFAPPYNRQRRSRMPFPCSPQRSKVAFSNWIRPLSGRRPRSGWKHAKVDKQLAF
jgi:hypothetical protein